MSNRDTELDRDFEEFDDVVGFDEARVAPWEHLVSGGTEIRQELLLAQDAIRAALSYTTASPLDEDALDEIVVLSPSTWPIEFHPHVAVVGGEFAPTTTSGAPSPSFHTSSTSHDTGVERDSGSAPSPEAWANFRVGLTAGLLLIVLSLLALLFDEDLGIGGFFVALAAVFAGDAAASARIHESVLIPARIARTGAVAFVALAVLVAVAAA